MNVGYSFATLISCVLPFSRTKIGMRESPSVRAVSQVSVKHVPRLPRWLFPQRALFSLFILPIEEAHVPVRKM